MDKILELVKDPFFWAFMALAGTVAVLWARSFERHLRRETPPVTAPAPPVQIPIPSHEKLREQKWTRALEKTRRYVLRKELDEYLMVSAHHARCSSYVVVTRAKEGHSNLCALTLTLRSDNTLWLEITPYDEGGEELQGTFRPYSEENFFACCEDLRDLIDDYGRSIRRLRTGGT